MSVSFLISYYWKEAVQEVPNCKLEHLHTVFYNASYYSQQNTETLYSFDC
jgi:hypothetical protein